MKFLPAIQRTTACAAMLCAAALMTPLRAAAEDVVQVQAAWVRAAVQGQMGTGAFMKLTARQARQLVGVSTPAAGVSEVHEMKMNGDVMTMRPVPALDLPAGRTVELKPGGFHLMLMDLKKPLPAGSSVELTLLFKNAQGVEHRQTFAVPVAATAPRSPDKSGTRGPPVAPADGGAHAGDHKH